MDFVCPSRPAVGKQSQRVLRHACLLSLAKLWFSALCICSLEGFYCERSLRMTARVTRHLQRPADVKFIWSITLCRSSPPAPASKAAAPAVKHTPSPELPAKAVDDGGKRPMDVDGAPAPAAQKVAIRRLHACLSPRLASLSSQTCSGSIAYVVFQIAVNVRFTARQ